MLAEFIISQKSCPFGYAMQVESFHNCPFGYAMQVESFHNLSRAADITSADHIHPAGRPLNVTDSVE